MPDCRFLSKPGTEDWTGSVPCAYGDNISGRSGRTDGGHGHLWHGGAFGQQEPARAGNSHCTRSKEVLQAAVGRAFKLLAFGSAAGLLLGILASRVRGCHRVQTTSRDPVVLAGVVIAMFLPGLLAAWIPTREE